MNNGMKKSLAVLVATMTMTSGAAYASTDSPQAKEGYMQTTSAVSAQQNMQITVNGVAITESGFQNADEKETMLPLRAVTEALGFSLTWNQADLSVELIKDRIFTTVKTGADRYIINKMEKSLGIAPVLVDNKMYVPASFIGEVLHGTVLTSGNSVSITLAEQKKSVTTKGVVTSVYQSEKYNSVHINGVGTEGLVLNIGEDTVIETADGKKLGLSDLTLGMQVEAEHSLVMTMSLPPQTPTYKITVLNGADQKDMLGTAGAIEEVRTGTDGGTSLVIKGSGLTETSPSEVVLRLTDSTIITNKNGEKVDKSKLVKDAKVIGFYNAMLTKSLPPIGTAWKIVVETAPAAE
ncbi:copper amine oxidase N-terminal domain-containing protein [Paenibacillus sp. MBLB4367]|uniref:copper amine oxidase N-terminal domain-containing protein n=1 Tax=Paenibacillus sp. MBLB4367 TaxID=3384767 RepID=UPI0039084265